MLQCTAVLFPVHRTCTSNIRILISSGLLTLMSFQVLLSSLQ